MPRVYIETNGCAVLRHETQRYAKYFRANGWDEIDCPSDADLVLITTCGVIDQNEEDAIETIHKLVKASKKDSDILVGGCLPKINPERIAKIDHRIRLFGLTELSYLDNHIGARIKLEEISYNTNPLRKHSIGDPE